MKKAIYLLLFALLGTKSHAQTYFPPLTGTTWDTTAPSSLGWCDDSIQNLYSFLENSSSDAFILLKNGKIVLEKYFGTFTADSFHVWNSAGKTLTAYAVGIAQTEGSLSINDLSSDYLGAGWTSLTPTQENAITIWHQLTMTSGLDDGVSDVHCTDPNCLQYLADPGTRWAYHNGPYTLLDGVIENATGQTLNQFVQQKIGSKIGMTGIYFQSGYNNVFISKPRSMARFGLLLSQDGVWNGTTVQSDVNYLNAMRTPSQTLNPSYGYLTWLNGQSSYLVPGMQFSFNGPLMPNAPADVYAAEGKNGQIINVSPSDELVFIRMGDGFGESLIATQYNDTIWQYINRLSCSLNTTVLEDIKVDCYPNPAQNVVHLSGLKPGDEFELLNELGQSVSAFKTEDGFLTESLKRGLYFVQINRLNQKTIRKFVLN